MNPFSIAASVAAHGVDALDVLFGAALDFVRRFSM